MDSQASELGRLSAALEDLRRDRADAQTIMDSQARTIVSLRPEGERLAAEVAQLQAQLRDAQRLLGEIQATRGWRMLMRWRALRGRFVGRRRGDDGRARTP